MGQDFRGDPSSALLEVLDPEQNHTFNDHYLEVDYDLSDVMFVTTSNTLNIPAPLMDRMEIIRLSGYTEEEKFEIARRHLIPETLKENGLQPKEFVLGDAELTDVIRKYTREAGVRSLKRELSKLMRKAVRALMTDLKKRKIVISAALLEEYLGPAIYRLDQIDAEPQVGVVTGLAWTPVGGEILTIEGVMTHGKGRMTVTGNLKEVMKESISAANGYVRSKAPSIGVKPPVFDRKDIHVHVPEGATPKDGPSAGIAMATAIVSVLTGIPVNRNVAMTGEVTLRGRVLPIGGLKEKLLAALRSGIKTVLIPEENTRDLKEIPEIVTKGMEIIPVSRMDQVLKHALVRQPVPIVWDEEAEEAAAAARAKAGKGDGEGAMTH
jgi:ATP-dependent Lon protease